jgi:hypothetical protein
VYIDFKLENSNNSSLTEPKLAVFQIFRPASKGGTLQVKRKLQKEEEEEEEEEVGQSIWSLLFCFSAN